MNWKSIRLELGRTQEFPAGSASRTYLLRLPLGEDGRIDATSLQLAPARATVRRFWPNEPDLAGQVVATPSGWAFCYEIDGHIDRRCQFEGEEIRAGGEVTLIEPDGRRLPFFIASVEAR